jgi:hypothetical protein
MPLEGKIKANKIPHGQDVLNKDCPEATWDVGGLFIHDQNIFKILDIFKQKHNCILPIKSVFGCYGVRWSGGRTTMTNMAQTWAHNGWTPEHLIRQYNERDIACTFTFSNHLLKEEHLDDPSSNYLLDLLGRQIYPHNAVTVASPILSDYIRNKYPNLKQKASIVKHTVEHPKKRTFEYYDSLFEKFDLVYLHPDDNLNLNLLKKIADSGKVDKYINLINERCTFNCNIRNSHYDEIAQAQLDGWHGMFNFSKVDLIHHPDHPKTVCPRILNSEIRNIVLSKGEFKRVYDLGFRNFKLQGRDTPFAGLMYNFSTWMLEQDFIAERLFTY